MSRYWSPHLKSRVVHLAITLLLALPIAFSSQPSQALTLSVGEPFRGSLVNGVPFPDQFPGYYLRDLERSYTTPELVGALLDAFERFGEQYPDSCEVFIGDFSQRNGGWLNRHRSHQNGRDVDIGMFARGNVPLDGFYPMNGENLDVAKTWCFVQSLLSTQRVEYIFLDRSIMSRLYAYALSQGVDPNYLDRVFLQPGWGGKGSIIQHASGHRDHMHVRFFTPWSTLAGQMKKFDPQKERMIETAQQTYLPKRVNYYVKGNENSLRSLAQSFGVREKDLGKWNGISGGECPRPGTCLVFYKRGFELEPVHIARSLQPHHIGEAGSAMLASVQMSSSFGNASEPAVVRERQPAPAKETPADREHEMVAKVRQPAAGGQFEDNVRRKAQPAPQREQTLVIEVAQREISRKEAAARKEHDAANVKKTAAAPAPEPRVLTYTVRRGDTLARIARDNGLTVDALCRLNKMKKNEGLDPGDKLVVASEERSRSSNSVKTSSKSSERKDGYAVVARNGKSDRDRGDKYAKAGKGAKVVEKVARTHVLKRGETLWDVAKKYQVTTQVLCRLNRITTKEPLHPGMALKLPTD